MMDFINASINKGIRNRKARVRHDIKWWEINQPKYSEPSCRNMTDIDL